MEPLEIEEVIERLESHTQYYIPVNDLDAFEVALAALRAQQEAERNELLTLEQIKEMDGLPVWIEFIPDSDGEQLKFWALVSVDQDDGEVFLLNSIGGSSAYEEVWSDIQAIYRRPPKRPAI